MGNQICTTREDVMKVVKEKNVSFIQFWFTDVLGMLKSFAITPNELEMGMSEGMGFDGSSIEGFARIEESDMVAMPDPTTFRMLPWRPNDRPVARMFCDIVKPDQTPYEGDPRYVLKKLLQKIKEKGYTFNVGPELEYFYFKSKTELEPLDEGGYFDSRPLDMAADLRRETCLLSPARDMKQDRSSAPRCVHSMTPRLSVPPSRELSVERRRHS